jgi:GTP cyclohydrolase I
MNVDVEEELARRLLESIAPWYEWDIDEQLAETPKRFVSALREMMVPERDFEFTVFDANVRDAMRDNSSRIDEMVICMNIPFHSLCSHHVLPFFGRCDIAYIPNDKIAGLSKIPRTVQYMQSGLWMQEHLTDAIANYLEDNLLPKGIAVQMTAEHMCMSLRGIEIHDMHTTTSAMRGVFLDSSKQARTEFLAAIARS